MAKLINFVDNINDNSIGIASIDSLKVRIPFNLVEIHDPTLIDTLVLISKATGETLEDDIKRNSVEVREKGITTRYKIEHQVTSSQGVEKFLVILFNSKLLGIDYFQGIDKVNIHKVFNEIMKHQIVSFSFSAFLDGAVTDTDIKVDLLTKTPVVDIIKNLYDNALPKKSIVGACQKYLSKTNLGIQFSLRKTKSFKKAPFLKFYEKVRELKNNSVEFYAEHFLDKDMNYELLRIETTIKNKKHFKLLGLSDNKLGELLNDLTRTSHLAFENAFKAHILKNIVIASRLMDSKKLNFNDKVLITLIYERAINTEGDIKEVIDDVLKSLCNDKWQRHKHRKRINKLVELLKVESASNGSIFDDFLDMLQDS